ncbi:MAG: hypothetical protein M1816_006222 [Peltula sp. TS41687]|nr:MAG: hypothetical protein M1816_006222 [Peltula sp. TS41687]
MQCLTAPTREEVDTAHRRGKWLDIGIPSVKNLWRISPAKVILWALLGLSSIPLHLIWNSAIFDAISANEYYVFVVSSNFFEGARWNQTGTRADGVDWRLNNFQQNVTRTERMDNASAIAVYGKSYLTDRADILMVSYDLPDQKTNSSLLYYQLEDLPTGLYGDSRDAEEGHRWLCDGHDATVLSTSCDINRLEPSNLKFHGHAAKYFLSEQTDEQCELLFSKVIMIVVITCNCVKVVAMVGSLFVPQGNPLVTTGDAAASFLDLSDPNTQGRCLLARREVDKKTAKAAKRYRLHSIHWLSAVKLSLWFWCMGLCAIALGGSTVLLNMALYRVKTSSPSADLHALWLMGFGSVNSNALLNIGSNGKTVAATASHITLFILLANSPQLAFSFLYLLYNAIYTSMLQAAEWADFASQRKPLRVTFPKGKQRSTYFLQLPYRYGFPLMVASTVMHFLMSQSIFLVMIKRNPVTTNRSEMIEDAFVTCGYSIVPIIFAVALGGIMLLTLIMLGGLRRLPAGMPLMGSCSRVIAAACHRPEEDKDAARLPVQWGAVDDTEDREVGHCTFTSMEVTKPIEGRLYE